MGGCVTREEIVPRNHLIIDVQQIIADDAWKEFVVSSNKCCGFLRPSMKRSDYDIEVPMNYYLFETTKQEFAQNKKLPSLSSSQVPSKTMKGTSSQVDHTSPEEIGLKTNFRNDTDQNQMYNFRFEKTRKASVQVNYQRGFSIDSKTNFTIGIPQILPDGNLSTEISMNYMVTSSKGEMFEETLTTEATSQIVVSHKSVCSASIVMEERRLLAQFKVWVKMSMPSKQAIVNIKNKSGRVIFIKCINNLSMLFPPDTHIKENGKVAEDAVQFLVQGVVDGMQLANHRIHLKGRKLAGKNAKRGGNDLEDAAKGSDETNLTNISDLSDAENADL